MCPPFACKSRSSGGPYCPGNYERFLNIELTRDHNITSGKVYNDAIQNERRGDYLGKTVQIIPHVTDVIQKRLAKAARVCVDGRYVLPVLSQPLSRHAVAILFLNWHNVHHSANTLLSWLPAR